MMLGRGLDSFMGVISGRTGRRGVVSSGAGGAWGMVGAMGLRLMLSLVEVGQRGADRDDFGCDFGEGGIDLLRRGARGVGRSEEVLDLLADLFADFHFAGELQVDGGGEAFFVGEHGDDLAGDDDGAEAEGDEDVEEDGDDEAFFEEAHAAGVDVAEADDGDGEEEAGADEDPPTGGFTGGESVGDDPGAGGDDEEDDGGADDLGEGGEEDGLHGFDGLGHNRTNDEIRMTNDESKPNDECSNDRNESGFCCGGGFVDDVADADFVEAGFAAFARDGGEIFHDAAFIGADEDVAAGVFGVGLAEGGHELVAGEGFPVHR